MESGGPSVARVSLTLKPESSVEEEAFPCRGKTSGFKGRRRILIGFQFSIHSVHTDARPSYISLKII